ncbi:MAG: 3-hydroxyacyl-CoA dehydrogenase NAD-binding domain-containing protein [Myxococcota bacterium]|nr:3-hydroxyacyl-CoA dehydrogenase NAD-binding domain-containing protein [Myxococcota bacterium]
MEAFRLQRRDDGFAEVVFDVPDRRVNSFSRIVLDDLDRLLSALDGDRPRGVVLVSGKPDGFAAGADVQEFLAFGSADEIEAFSRRAHDLLDRIEDAPFPVVAAIHGACLGGGLEAALACHMRVATDDPATALALPEVQLGLLPGAGGLHRLVRLVGLRATLDLALTGRRLRADKAKRMGIVDEVVAQPILRESAMKAARRMADGWKPDGKRRSAADVLLDRNPAGRAIVLRQARSAALAKTRGHYPAPPRIIEAAAAACGNRREAREAAAKGLAELAMTDVSRQLVRLFLAGTAAKADRGVADRSVRPRDVRTIGVLGAGFMGAGVAAASAEIGVEVRLKDVDSERVGKGLAACRSILAERLKRRSITEPEFRRRMNRITGTTDASGLGLCDLIVEAVFEDIELKHGVLRETEEAARDDCVFASNTSSIPISRIAEASRRPETVVGMHYFSPVSKMPLLEVIVTPKTAPWVVATAVAFGKRQGKYPIVVNDGTGFYTSRILSAYLLEAAHVLHEGGRVEDIDRAMLDFGFPVGPMTLLDEVGIDVVAKASKVMHEAYGDRMGPPAAISAVVADGRLGRKVGRGFYDYSTGGARALLSKLPGAKRKRVDETVYDLLPGGRDRKPIPQDEIRARLSLAMCNEAALCLEQGILRSARDGDVGAVMGLGFPPFLGGPFRYVDSRGADGIVRELEALRERHGARFAPAPILVERARAGTRFHE